MAQSARVTGTGTQRSELGAQRLNLGGEGLQRLADLRLEGAQARRQLGVAAAVLADLLAVEDQGMELSGRDAVAREPWREQVTAVHLPGVPAGPWKVTREDGQQAQRGGIGLARGAPASIGARRDQAGGGRLFIAETALLLQRPQGGGIGGETFRQEFSVGPVAAWGQIGLEGLRGGQFDRGIGSGCRGARLSAVWPGGQIGPFPDCA